MPGREVVTRDALRRELVVNAATKPIAIGVAALVAVAAFVIGTPWLLLVAVGLYVGLAAATFFDQEEAERVGAAAYERAGLGRGVAALPSALAPEIAALLQRARDEEARIAETVAESDLPLDSVASEVSSLTTEMERIAGRAQSISKYLALQSPEDARLRLRELRDTTPTSADAARARDRAVDAVDARLRLWETMTEELDRFKAEMEHLIASLGIVHGQLVRMDVANETHLQDEVARELGELRERMGVFAEGMREAVSQLDG
jgi:hypothetical protein